jgi:hypothetical protein
VGGVERSSDAELAAPPIGSQERDRVAHATGSGEPRPDKMVAMIRPHVRGEGLELERAPSPAVAASDARAPTNSVSDARRTGWGAQNRVFGTHPVRATDAVRPWAVQRLALIGISLEATRRCQGASKSALVKAGRNLGSR